MEHLLHAAGWAVLLVSQWLYLRSRTRRRITAAIIRVVSRRWHNARRTAAAVGRIAHPYQPHHVPRRTP